MVATFQFYKKILDRTDIKMIMRYAHFVPDHFEDAVRLNPLKVFDAGK